MNQVSKSCMVFVPNRQVVLAAVVALSALALPVHSFAKDGDAPTQPIGNPKAPQGGTFTMNLPAEPATLNPITGTDGYLIEDIEPYVLDTLLERDPNTYGWNANLAEKLDISPDGKTFTFTIRKEAKFHDGKPVTAEDVKFSFDVVFDPKYNAASLRPYFEGIEKAEIVDPLTVRFTAKSKYFGNLETLADTMRIIPKHFYGNADEGKKKNKTIMGSGPYKLEKYDQGQSIMLVRNKDWWGNKVDFKKGQYNFQNIRFRFIKDENIEIESLKKGDIDFMGLGPEAYMKKTEGPEWGKSVLKVKTENSGPKGFMYVGWNLKNDLFKDRDVRTAMAYLTNRDEMIKKFRYNMSMPATGPWYLQSEYADPKVKPIPYDPKKARELLTKAGWTDSDKNGVLDKVVNGKKQEFHFTLIYGSEDFKKYWELYQSDLKQAGIIMDLQQLDWNALLKAVDEKKFDAAALAWGGGSVDLDPKQIWHSESAGKDGSNFVSYKVPEVDKLIDEAREELDKKKRIVLMRKIYGTIAADMPYDFFFNDRYSMYATTSRIKTPKPTFKYLIGKTYWWAAPAK
jgi:microcin C transport system substrate-binding protein